MALNNKIRLENIWLTSDGTETGFPCVVDVQGLPDLKMKYWGTASRNARGNAEMNLSLVAGVDITLAADAMKAEVFNAIVELFNDCLDEDTTFEFEVQGETGNYELDADPNPENSVTWRNDLAGMIEGVEIKLITRAADEEEI